MNHAPPISRRTAIKLGVASAGTTLIPHARAQSTNKAKSDRPRNVIFLVADGMCSSVPGLAELFSHVVRSRGTHWMKLATNPATSHALYDVTPLDALVTDSAASATAWASGSNVRNGSLNVLPDGTNLTPLGRLVKKRGMALGLVTTTRLTHATPAAFVVNAPSRGAEDEIAEMYLSTGADVLLGGGSEKFSPQHRSDGRDMVQKLQQAGYKTCAKRKDLLKARGSSKLFGVFWPSHLPYMIDCHRDKATCRDVPTLKEMTEAALSVLTSKPDGFLLVVEAGRVDHAAHTNDASAMLHDQLAYDDTIGLVAEFCRDQPDTLVVITTDHTVGNCGVNGLDRSPNTAMKRIENLAAARASFGEIHKRIASHSQRAGSEATLDQITEAVHWGSGIEIDQRSAQAIADALADRQTPELNVLEAGFTGILGQVLGNHTAIGWTGSAHTGDPVLGMAFGPGSERFAGFMPHTRVFDHVTDLLGINHHNPKAQ